MEEEFEDTKEAIRIVCRRRTDNTMAKRKVQKDKQRSAKYTYKTKDRVTRTGDELRSSGRVSSSCSTSDTRHVNLVTNPVICHECDHPLQCQLHIHYPSTQVTF